MDGYTYPIHHHHHHNEVIKFPNIDFIESNHTVRLLYFTWVDTIEAQILLFLKRTKQNKTTKKSVGKRTYFPFP